MESSPMYIVVNLIVLILMIMTVVYADYKCVYSKLDK